MIIGENVAQVEKTEDSVEIQKNRIVFSRGVAGCEKYFAIASA